MSDQKLPILRDDQLLFMNTAEAPVPGTIVPCLICTKPFIMRPYEGVPDQVCPECWRNYQDCAVVVCRACKITIARLRPQITESGFYIRPRAVLHTGQCSICAPGLPQSVIDEIAEYNRLYRPKRVISTARS